MTATYTFDVFMSFDGYGSVSRGWGGYWGKQGPELLARRLALYNQKQRMVFGANIFVPSQECWPQAARATKSATHGSRACGTCRRPWSRLH